MKTDLDLVESHKKLSEHFRNLSSARGKLPVFAIEHGLDDAEIAQLKRVLSRKLEEDPYLQDARWSWNYLPLLVIATEVGYRYRGTGTNFWPLLAQDLGIETGLVFRTSLTHLFAIGHRDVHLARPGTTSWEQHFPYISWPVCNALAPLEIQPSLADAIRHAVRDGIVATDTEGLLTHIRTLASGHASRRFDNWLQHTEVAFEVIRRLLAPDVGGWLSEATLHRINIDIRKNRNAYHAIMEARISPKKRHSRVPKIPSSQFVLALTDGMPEQVLVRGPALSAAMREDIIAGLSIHSDQIRTEKNNFTILLRSFLAGGEIPLGDITVLPSSALRRGDAAPTDRDTILEQLQPRPSEFFLVETDGTKAHAIFPSDKIPVNAAVIRRSEFAYDGRVEIRHLDPAAPDDAITLCKQGFIIVRSVSSMHVTGMSAGGGNGRFLNSFPVFAIQEGNSVHEFLLDGVQPAVEKFRFRSAEWAAFRPALGEHEFRKDDGNDNDNVKCVVIEPPDLEPATINVMPADVNIADLEQGRLGIKITAPLALEQLPIRLRLQSPDEADIISEDIIPRLPAYFTGRSPLLQTFQEKISKRLNEHSTLRFSIEVEGLLQKRILLPPLPRQFHYDTDSHQWNCINDGDSQKLPSQTATPQNPLLLPMHHDCTGTRLILPDTTDCRALASGIIISENSSLRPGFMEHDDIKLPTLLREPYARNDGIGLVDLVRAYLAWQMAEASNPLANWSRWSVERQLGAALVKQLCGAEWQQQETGLNLSILSPHGMLLQIASDLGLTSGKDLPEVAVAADQKFLHARILDRLRSVLPDITKALNEWKEDDNPGDRLDTAIIDSYNDLGQYLKENGRHFFDDVDMWREAADWHTALKRTCSRDMHLLPMFKRFILPETHWKVLVKPLYEDMDEDDLVDLLDRCFQDASRRSRRWMGRAELRAMLQLWLSPKTMIEDPDWTRLLTRGLSDIQSTRAVRYVALRRKLALRDMPEWSVV